MIAEFLGGETDCLLPLDVGFDRQEHNECKRDAGYRYYYNANYGSYTLHLFKIKQL